MSNDDRLDRLERLVETMVATTTTIHNDLLALARENKAEHAQYRKDIRAAQDDIKRLYQAFSDHHREGHA